MSSTKSAEMVGVSKLANLLKKYPASVAKIIAIPPMVGVPCFVMWVAGPSARMN